MAATIERQQRHTRGRVSDARPRPLLGAFVFGAIAVNAVVLAVGVAIHVHEITTVGWRMLGWIVAEAAIGFASVAFGSGSELGLDAPLLLAAGFVLGPAAAGLIAFFGYVDVREIRRAVPLRKALFNRSQISLSVMAAAAAFRALGVPVGAWPIVIFAALVAVAIDVLLNWGMVAVVRMLAEQLTVRQALTGLSIGRPGQFAMTYAAFALAGAALADVYARSGLWSLLMFAVPTLLARQAFFATGSLDEVVQRSRAKDHALLEAAKRVADERRDERLAIAAGIHDEVLPPIFKVHLMGQVVKNDLATGQLLALEADVPELVSATVDANAAMRRLIGGLRASPLGATGLAGTLRMLCDELASETTSAIRATLEDVDAAPVVQLLAYQVVREALRNAVRHATASRIDVVIDDDEHYMRLVVADDGVGFSRSLVDQSRHFGLQLIRERVELFGGTVVIDSVQGRGTTVVARLPLRPSENY
jgi:signal transduction histidine kinase